MLDWIQRLRIDRLAYRMWRYNPRGLVRLYQHHRFDREHGVSTRGYGDLRYEPTPAPMLAEMISRLPGDLSRFVFIDVGSGKGKVLLLASAYPFKRILGVERFEDLHRIAVENLRAFSYDGSRCRDIVPLCEDASVYLFPPEPAVVYFFNPFPLEVLERVLTNLETSLFDRPRDLYVIFYAPILQRGTPWDRRRIFDASPALEVLCSEKHYSIYRAGRTLTPPPSRQR